MSQFGLILCGGESSRMGTDKAFIPYHGIPQWEYVYQLMKPLCDEVYISCQATQLHLFPKDILTISDVSSFANAGPLSGILAAFKSFPGNHWLVCGCDYPLIEQADLIQLLANGNEASDIVCFSNPVSNMDEPLIAWYNSEIKDQLFQMYQSGAHSLRLNFSKWRTHRIIPDEWNRLFSFDTPEQRDQILPRW